MRSDRGAILIQVAIGLLVLTAFSGLVIDMGILWVGRRQAQNAADAGALAGAVSLAFDGDTRLATGPAKTVAYNTARRNLVIGEQPDVTDPSVAATDVFFYSDNPAKFPAECADNSCIRVDAYRNQQRANALPTFFLRAIGVTDQGTKATATAQATIGDSTECLKPWAVVDKWDEHWPIDPAPWTLASTFDKYETSGKNKGSLDPTIKTPDVYIPPTTSTTGSGFYPYNPDGSPSPWYGLELTLKAGSANDFDYTSGWFMALALADSTGGKDYKNNIKGCINVEYTIGGELPIDTEPGDKVGPTRQAVMSDGDSLYNTDPTAYWDTTMNGGRGGVNSPFAVSPRIVPIPLVNPDAMATAMKDGRSTVPISNIMGFFIEGLTADNKGVRGRLVSMPGLKASGAPAISGASAWLKLIQLIR